MARKTTDHDGAHRALFTHREMVEDLLLRFVKEKWVEELDFATLERESELSLLPELERRERDLVWSVRFRGRTLYVLIMLEFQSRPDATMALRQMVYVTSFYQELYRQKRVRRRQKLPPVLPVVLYNGPRAWRAALSVEELIADCPDELERYQPRMSYLLIDELHAPAVLGPERNTVAGAMLLQRVVGEPAAEIVSRLCSWLSRPEHESLRNAFREFIFEYADSQSAKALASLLDHPEDPMTIKQRWQQYSQNLRDEGREQGLALGIEKGIEKGRREGQKRGKTAVLLKQLRLKFPHDPIWVDAPALEKRMAKGSAAEFERWTERVLTAQSLQDVFN